MSKNYRIPVLLALLALTVSTLACGFSPAAQAPQQEEPLQPAPATEAPASAPSGNDTNSNATVSCSQLIPPDQIAPLLNNITPSNLSENAYPGGSICSWLYTPNGSSETHLFYLEVNFGTDAATAWEMKRNAELAQEPSDIVVISIDGLGDESYAWASQATGLYVVFARKGDKTLIMRFIPQDVLYMANESGIIDMADRFFSRF